MLLVRVTYGFNSNGTNRTQNTGTNNNGANNNGTQDKNGEFTLHLNEQYFAPSIRYTRQPHTSPFTYYSIFLFPTEDNLSLVLTGTLVLVLIGIAAAFAIIVQPRCCKRNRRRRPAIQLSQGCTRSDNAGEVEQGDVRSEHEYDVVRLPPIPEDTTSEGLEDDLPALDSGKYSGEYASPYEQVNFGSVGEYSTVYATAEVWNSAKEIGRARKIGKDKLEESSVPSETMVNREATETTSMDEVLSTSENTDSAVGRDMEPQLAIEAHND